MENQITGQHEMHKILLHVKRRFHEVFPLNDQSVLDKSGNCLASFESQQIHQTLLLHMLWHRFTQLSLLSSLTVLIVNSCPNKLNVYEFFMFSFQK